jgi:hypothetical protein
VVLIAASALTDAPRVEANAKMCGWKATPRPQTVSVDPWLEGTGITAADVLAAFEPWNQLFLKYHGFPIFVPHYGDWQTADILIAANVYPRTWVATTCTPGYVQRGNNHSILFLGYADAWRNRGMLSHELGHTLGLADHGAPAEHAGGHIGFVPCGTYTGVMSYCTGPQSWFLDYEVAGLVLDGQLVRDYFW